MPRQSAARKFKVPPPKAQLPQPKAAEVPQLAEYRFGEFVVEIPSRLRKALDDNTLDGVLTGLTRQYLGVPDRHDPIVYKAAVAKAVNALQHSALQEQIIQRIEAKHSSGNPALDLSNIAPRAGGLMTGDQTKSFVHEGIRWFPLSVAAPIVQAPTSTIHEWIKKDTKFQGQSLQSYYLAPVDRYFVSEESIQRMATRFIKWPSQEPAGLVTIGMASDQNGYIGLPDAAHTVGVDHHTMWRWATKGTAPTDKPLDVIKDPAGDQYYIREKDVSTLKKIVPRSGLRRGRRPQVAPRNG